MEKNWQIEKRKFDNIIDQLLYNRGVIENKTEIKKKEKYFHPDFNKDLYDPFLLSGLKRAIERIRKAKVNNEIVGIFADYDADGIPGAALLFLALQKLNINAVVFIPSREGGYGLSQEGIDYLIGKKCTLIITVDLGIRNFDEALYCKEKKIDLIITDHHLPEETIPKADIVINPKIKGDRYPYKDLSGCAVVFKLISGLKFFYPDLINDKFLKWNLDLVAISTIADVVPLTGENRILAKYGLIVLQKTKNIGLIELYKIAEIAKEKIGVYEIGFQIGPRINAPGRMDHATKSYEFLITQDPVEAKELSLWLNKQNQIRQEKMNQTLQNAIVKIERDKLNKNKIIIVSGKWLKGIIGPTASKIAEMFYRPVILFSENDTEYVGSARSVENINIVKIFEEQKRFILRFGGHKGAAGLSVLKNKFKEFVDKITNYSNKTIDSKYLIKTIRADLQVKLTEINFQLLNLIKQFEPFGIGNAKPIFCLRNVEIIYPKLVGKDCLHLSCSVRENNTVLKAIYFNCQEKIDSKKKYDILFSPMIEFWQGKEYLKLNIVDIRECDQRDNESHDQ